MTHHDDAWQTGRGPLSFLPVSLFVAQRPSRAIPIAAVIALAGSVAIGVTIAMLFDGGTGLAMGRAAPWLLWVLIAIVSPVLESLVMAIGLVLLRLALPAWPAAVASAIAWGLLHALAAPLWGLVVWWPFLIFSIIWLTWRPRGFWLATTIAAAVHALHNLPSATLIALAG